MFISVGGQVSEYTDYVLYYEPLTGIIVSTPYGSLTEDNSSLSVPPMKFDDFPAAGFPITISGSGGSDHGIVVTWGDGSIEAVNDPLPVELNHTYTTGGSLDLRVTATTPAKYADMCS